VTLPEKIMPSFVRHRPPLYYLGSLLALVTAVSRVAAGPLTLRDDPTTQTRSVFRDGVAAPILTRNARTDFRPHLHPVVSPDGKSVLTEYSPGHQ